MSLGEHPTPAARLGVHIGEDSYRPALADKVLKRRDAALLGGALIWKGLSSGTKRKAQPGSEFDSFHGPHQLVITVAQRAFSPPGTGP